MKTVFRIAASLLVAALAGCAGLVDKPVRATLYDFGPGRVTPAAAPAPQATRPALVLADVDAAGALDGSAVLYRLGYADDHQLRPYAQARWSASPPQLVRQRLREQIGRDRIVLNPGEGAALARSGGLLPRALRIELEEFSQFFSSPTESVGLVRLRATLLENTAGGEKLLAQRDVVVQRPAPSADAAGGVRALSAAVDAAADELVQWLAQVP
ncbi:ABC-type transport auxiliary lipoprotein family protein [Caenimonas terrae]|uniref:ABC-type transport auxiliary lipoprotein family protein n=1 Tax=Caenimonas terrae TaxID=696074 RepID=A0ABW0NDU6_9BURK